jgi:4-amino-4-deoxy-L-arabinose transferase-like glycosyltransferase
VATGARRGAQGPVVWSGAFIGLALLVKPLMALVAPALFGVWLLSIGRARLLKGLAASVAVALAVALPWHLSMVDLHGRAFTDQYFGNQIVERAAGALFDPQPWWWYAGHLLRSYWPWLATLALALVAIVRRGAPSRDRAALLLCLVWCAAWLVLLSAFADKRARYALLLYPFLSIASAVWLVKLAPMWIRRGGGRRWVDLGAVVAACVGLALVFTPLHTRLHEPPEPDWAAINALLRERPDAPLYDDGLDLADRSRLYLAQGRWPMDALGARPPARGAIVVRELREGEAAEKWGEVVFCEGRLVAERAR